MTAHTRHHELTKADLRLIRDQWDEKTVKQLAEQIGCTMTTIYKVAKAFRDEGLSISYKKQRGELNLLIREVAKEV